MVYKFYSEEKQVHVSPPSSMDLLYLILRPIHHRQVDEGRCGVLFGEDRVLTCKSIIYGKVDYWKSLQFSPIFTMED